MAGLIAVVGDGRNAAVDEAELSSLVDAYVSLRGDGPCQRLAGGTRARVAVMAPAGVLGSGIVRQAGSWAAYIGAPSYPGPLVGCPAEALDGQFAMVSHHAVDDRLEILTDPFGLQTLYRARVGNRHYFSTSVLVLAKHLGTRPSRLGLQIFLRAGTHFGALTNWEGITRVEPATRISFGRDRVETGVYWRPEVDRLVGRLGLAEAADHCVEVAATMLRDRFADCPAPWCDLTGGFDSRLVALLLDRAGMSFATNTVGEDDNVDVLLGAEAARIGGWRWEQRKLDADWPRRSSCAIDRALAWGDGQMEVTQLAEVLTFQARHAATAPVLFTGGGGEHWRDYAWQQEIPAGGRTTTVNFDRWVNVRFLHRIDLSPLRADPTQLARENLVERCRAYAAPFAGELNSVALDMLYAYKSMGHFGAYQSASRGTIHQEMPFYAKPSFSAAFSVAPSLRNSHRLMRQAIRLLNPELAALATTVGGPAEPLTAGNAYRFLPYLHNRASGIARKLTQHLPGPTIGAVRVPVVARSLAGRARLLDELSDRGAVDAARMRSGSLYDGRRLADLTRSPSATGEGWKLLGRIVTAELALEAVDAALD